MKLEELKEYDWEQALGFADFSESEIKTIIASYEGYNDGEPWMLVVELNDGRFGFVTAWCDYTGWDCQSGGSSYIKDTLEELQRWDMSSKDRRRLDMILEDLDN